MIKVAYILSLYDGEKPSYFVRAMESILNQVVEPNVVIRIYVGVDGEINDSLKKVLETYKNKYYKLIESTENIGQGAMLNIIIKNLEDEDFIFRMDTDDICLKDRTQLQLSYFHENPECLALGASMYEIDGFEQVVGFKLAHRYATMGSMKYYRNPFNHPTMALRRIFFDRVGVYDDSLRKAQDYELWLRALSLGIVMENLEIPLLKFRVDKNFHLKRSSKENIMIEFKVALGFLYRERKLFYLPILIIKSFVRVLPSRVVRLFYSIVRSH